MDEAPLNDLRNRLLQELAAAVESVQRDRTGAEHAEHEPVVYDEAEMASLIRDRAVNKTMVEAHTKRLHSIEQALERIDRGEYGSCRRCEDAIQVKRLIAMPSATLCLRCQSEIELTGSTAAPSRPQLDVRAERESCTPSAF